MFNPYAPAPLSPEPSQPSSPNVPSFSLDERDQDIARNKAKLHLFANIVGNKYQLSPVQRDDLKFVISETFPAKSMADVRIAILLMAVSFTSLNAVLAVRKETQEMKPVLEALRIRFVDKFELMVPQKNQIIALCKDKVFEYCRTDYKDVMAQEVEHYIIVNTKFLDFPPIVGNAAQEHTLHTACRLRASAVCNQFRQLIMKTIVPGEAMPLDMATLLCAEKFRLGGVGTEPLRNEYQFRVCLLRRFTKDLYKIIRIEDTLDTEVSSELPSQKKKVSGCVPAGDDFWGWFNKFLANKIKAYGDHMFSTLWQQYYKDLIARDYAEWGSPRGMPQMVPIPIEIAPVPVEMTTNSQWEHMDHDHVGAWPMGAETPMAPMEFGLGSPSASTSNSQHGRASLRNLVN